MFDFFKKLERRHAYKRTVHELQNMSNRELADIGIMRADIHDIARMSVNKNR